MPSLIVLWGIAWAVCSHGWVEGHGGPKDGSFRLPVEIVSWVMVSSLCFKAHILENPNPEMRTSTESLH